MAFSTSCPVKCGDQIYLRYGGHSNAFLFVEYGFVLSLRIRNAHITSGEITVDPDIEDMIRSSVNFDVKEQLLKDKSYWG
jgi:hypothetical protein